MAGMNLVSKWIRMEVVPMNYHYPIDESWSQEEIITVIQFFNCIEKAYEHRIERQQMGEAYRAFKQVIPSKAEEKRLFRSFEKASSYAAYPVVKKAHSSEQSYLSMS